jgi:cellulose synthase/poly-beta-1,6-N-acetylglucosamine synthase-like glycosyltransferase
MPSISYAITACNEHVELERLLDLLNEHIRPEDEIMLQLDSTATDEVKQVALKYNVGTKYDYHRVWYGLNNDFASYKNHLSGICSRDAIFQIDADEYPHPELILNLPNILEANPEIDVFLTPRINTVE